MTFSDRPFNLSVSEPTKMWRGAVVPGRTIHGGVLSKNPEVPMIQDSGIVFFFWERVLVVVSIHCAECFLPETVAEPSHNTQLFGAPQNTLRVQFQCQFVCC